MTAFLNQCKKCQELTCEQCWTSHLICKQHPAAPADVVTFMNIRGQPLIGGMTKHEKQPSCYYMTSFKDAHLNRKVNISSVPSHLCILNHINGKYHPNEIITFHMFVTFSIYSFTLSLCVSMQK